MYTFQHTSSNETPLPNQVVPALLPMGLSLPAQPLSLETQASTSQQPISAAVSSDSTASSLATCASVPFAMSEQLPAALAEVPPTAIPSQGTPVNSWTPQQFSGNPTFITSPTSISETHALTVLGLQALLLNQLFNKICLTNMMILRTMNLLRWVQQSLSTLAPSMDSSLTPYASVPSTMPAKLQSAPQESVTSYEKEAPNALAQMQEGVLTPPQQPKTTSNTDSTQNGKTSAKRRKRKGEEANIEQTLPRTLSPFKSQTAVKTNDTCSPENIEPLSLLVDTFTLKRQRTETPVKTDATSNQTGHSRCSPS